MGTLFSSPIPLFFLFMQDQEQFGLYISIASFTNHNSYKHGYLKHEKSQENII